MTRNCNLELRLMPPSISFSPKNCTTPYFSMRNNQNNTEEKEQQPQQLTIFYNGKVAVSDVTELQAKALIYLASRGMEEKTNTPPPIAEPSSPVVQSQTGLSMKGSLRRFLQKRKNRIQATSPYHH